MREYEIEIQDETYKEQGSNYSTALAKAMRKFEQKLKEGKVRDKVGNYFRIDIERVE